MPANPMTDFKYELTIIPNSLESRFTCNKHKKYMKSHTILTFTFICSICVALISCEKEVANENRIMISVFNDDESHKTGKDCMNCHFQEGNGEGSFNTAGSVYDISKSNPYPNATVRLYANPDGEGNPVASIQVDKKGNFYTTESIDYSGVLYTIVTGSGGKTKIMNSGITSGACNSCHGVSTDRIWVE